MSTSFDDQIVQAAETGRRGSYGVRWFFQCALFYFSWTLFGLLSLGWSVIAGVLCLVLPARLGHPLGRFVINQGFRMFIRLLTAGGLVECDLTPLDALEKETSLVIAPNHPGRLDVLLMISRLPRGVCIIKARLWSNLFLGAGARLAGYIRNDTPMTMVKTAAKEIRNGQSLLVFPEGTRTSGTSVGAFHGSFALIARLANAPIQTVFIENASGYLGKGWPPFKRPDFPLVFRVRLGQRFTVPDKVQAFVARLEEYYRDEVGRDLPPRAR